ncbi:MAG TPA: glycosyltransferase [Trueperaceae bacterium]
MSVVDALQLVVLVAFAVINGTQLGGLVLASRALLMRDRRASRLEEVALARAATYLPVSFLVPAYNEEATIVGSVRSLLAMHYPEFELIVVSDGSKDGTMAVLHEAFDLVPAVASPRRCTQHARVIGTWRSATHPALTVIEKENGGRSDALNAAIEQARYPICVVIDADSLVDPEALLLAGTRFLDDPTLVALGGSIRPVNDAIVSGGSVRLARTPRNFLARWQQLEYARAFTAARVAMSELGCLILISGAFGLFRRSALIAVGGYRTDTVGEDFELTVRLHRYFRDRGEPYRIEYLVDPVCWTQVPEEPRVLRNQRDRWHRGLWEVLWAHRDMLFNPRYGRIGFFALPYMWFVEGLSPVFEVSGYVLVAALAVLGQLDAAFAAAFFALALLYGLLVSLGTTALDVVLPHSPRRAVDRLRLLNAVMTESLWYRPWLAFVRLVATFGVRSKRGKWGTMTRRSFG